jgi:hypothetical protein
MGGHKILGGFGYIGSATNMYEMCHVTTVYGDWGLEDEITLRSTTWTVDIMGGAAGIGAETVHRTIEGNLN